MKTQKCVALMFVFLAFPAMNIHAAVTIFDANDVIADGDTHDIVFVKGDDTVIEMTGGTVNSFRLTDTSTVNISGGTITAGIYLYDAATLNFTGGLMQNYYGINAYEKSNVNIIGSADVPGIESHGFSVITIDSDEADPEIMARDYSTVNVLDGDGLYVGAWHYSTVNLHAGNVFEIWAASKNRVNITGGNIRAITLGDYSANLRLSGGFIIEKITPYNTYRPDLIDHDDKHRIEIIGYNLNAVPYSASTFGQITGSWNNGSPFTIHFDGPEVLSYIILYDGVVPVDCVNPPRSDATNDCQVNMFDLAVMGREWLTSGLEIYSIVENNQQIPSVE